MPPTPIISSTPTAPGRPARIWTFFPWPGLPPARPGEGQIVEVPFAVPTGSLTYWGERFEEHGVAHEPVETRFGEETLPFRDPHGLRLALVASDDPREWTAWARGPVPAEQQLRGMHTARLWVRDLEPTEALLTELLGFRRIAEDDGWHRFGTGDGGSGELVEVRPVGDEHRGSGGVGGVHHVAWRTHDADAELELRNALARACLRPTPLIDRFWFQSVYFREPGGVLFELATDGPGFAHDEDPERLGETLMLPPWMEGRRASIEAGLPTLEGPRLRPSVQAP